MKLITLGGAAAGPGPRQGCSGYFVASDRTQIVLDLGPGTLLELRHHVENTDLDAIVISHMHLDHILDLFALWWGGMHQPNPRDGQLPLWLPPGGRDVLMTTARSLASAADAAQLSERVFDVREYDPSLPLTVGSLTLSFAPTRHYIPCWAIRVASEQAGLVYTADNGDAASLVPFTSGADVLVAEATLPDAPGTDGWRGVSTASEVATLARDAGVQTLVLTHIWAEHDATAASAHAQAAFGGRIEVARPGLTIDCTPRSPTTHT